MVAAAHALASCSSALNSRFPDASVGLDDGSFEEWCCGFDGRSWRFGRLGLVCCVMRHFLLLCFPEGSFGRVGERRGRNTRSQKRHHCFFIAGAPSTRISSGCHRARLGRLRPANGLLALLRQPGRERRAQRWPRTPGKAKLSEPHGARRARSFRAHRRRALFHLRARGPRGAPQLLTNGRS